MMNTRLIFRIQIKLFLCEGGGFEFDLQFVFATLAGVLWLMYKVSQRLHLNVIGGFVDRFIVVGSGGDGGLDFWIRVPSSFDVSIEFMNDFLLAFGCIESICI